MTEAEPVDEDDALPGVGDVLAHQVLAADPEMNGPLRHLRDDLGNRQVGDFDPGKPGQRAAILARAARLHQVEAGAGKEGVRVLLQAALGGDGEHQRSAHVALPIPASRSIHAAKPTAGIGVALPNRVSSPS